MQKIAGLIPGSERSPGEENDNPLQYSSLGNPMDRGAWRATVQGVTKRVGRDWSNLAYMHTHDLATKTTLYQGRKIPEIGRPSLGISSILNIIMMRNNLQYSICAHTKFIYTYPLTLLINISYLFDWFDSLFDSLILGTYFSLSTQAIKSMFQK